MTRYTRPNKLSWHFAVASAAVLPWVLPWILPLRLATAADERPGAQADSIAGAVQQAPDAPGRAVSVVKLDREGRPRTEIEERAEKFDPAADTWDTEVLSAVVGDQLKVLQELIEHPERIDLEHISQLADDDFACDTLQPTNLEQVFHDDQFTVRRWNVNSISAPPAPARGPHALAAALRTLGEVLGDAHDIRAKLKLVKIDKAEKFITTTVYFEASGRTARQAVQQNGSWVCRWTYPQDQTGPRLLSIELEAYELVTNHAAGGRQFADCTAAALGHNKSYHDQILPGINHWLPRISSHNSMTIFGHHGLAVGDVNGDGLDDLYVCEAGGLPNRLYVQNPDGTATDVSAAAGVDWLESASSALLIDLDNDGDQDLAVALRHAVMFAENDGRGVFTSRVQVPAVANATSMSAADVDVDGDLDLYVCGYMGGGSGGAATELPTPVPFHDANNGGANALLRNEGGFRFTNATAESGLDVNNRRFSFAAAWDDYDNDGDPDLYVANDYGRNNLYRNDAKTQGGDPSLPPGKLRFTDVAAAAGVEDVASGMSVAWGDYNRDGWMDLYVGNMFSAAGNRIAFQRRFTDTNTSRDVAVIQRMARGNTLFASAGKPGPDGSVSFADKTEAAAVAMGRWAWASKFADVNNDGWLDVLVTNGYITNDDSGDL